MVLFLTAAGKDLLRQLFGSRLLAYVGGKLIKTPEVDQDTFISAVSDTPGTYEFTYDGSTWIHDGSVVSLENYGITVTETALSGDHVIVKLYEEIASYVKFTSVSIGNGNQSDLGETVTELGHEMNRPMMTACDRENDFVTLTTYLNNNSVEVAYRATEMGVWAENPDDTSEEILFAYGYEEPESAMFIPAGGEYLMETTIILKVYVSDVEDVTASISQSMQFVLKSEFEGHTHDAGDIVSGVLSEAFGGTGVDSLAALSSELKPLLMTAETFTGNIDDLEPGVVWASAAASGHPDATSEQGYVITLKSKFSGKTTGQIYLNTAVGGTKAKIYYRNRTSTAWSDWRAMLDSKMDLTQFIGGTGAYSPAGHTHAATDIVSGMLPVSRGGTGVGTLANLAALLDGDASGSTAYLAKAAHTHNASDIASGLLSVARGGTGVDSLASLASSLKSYLLDELKGYFAPVVGYYVGNGQAKRFIGLGFAPDILIVSDNGSGVASDTWVSEEHDQYGDNTVYYGTCGGVATPGHNVVAGWDNVTSNGALPACMTSWVGGETAVMIGDRGNDHGFYVGNSGYVQTNYADKVYTYIAFRLSVSNESLGRAYDVRGTYTGNGATTTSLDINLGFTPSLVMIFTGTTAEAASLQPTTFTQAAEGSTVAAYNKLYAFAPGQNLYHGLCGDSYYSASASTVFAKGHGGAVVITNGFAVQHYGSTGQDVNASGKTYTYFAWR